MTLKNMIARVMRALPTIDPSEVSEPDIVDILNEGLKYIASLSHITKTEEYTINEEQEYLDLPDDMLRLKNVYWSEDKKELIMGKRDLPKDLTGEPIYYYLRQGKIYLRPIPDLEEQLYLVYIPKYEAMVEDNDTPGIEHIEEFLIAYTLEKIHLEANSPMVERWEMEKVKALGMYLEIYDSEYVIPFNITPLW